MSNPNTVLRHLICKRCNKRERIIRKLYTDNVTLTAKLKIAEEGLENIIDHTWTAEKVSSVEHFKWINEFVDIAQSTLEELRKP